MKTSHLVWCLIIGIAALVPLGIKAITRQGPRQHTLETDTVQAGQTPFHHEWKDTDPLSPNGDGLGPVFNAKSCVACHKQGGPGGGGGLEHNVTTFTLRTDNPKEGVRVGVVHSNAVRYPETL